ncbi:MAG: major facilitator superfamily domain-containing protein [Benniella sp.]|nr:MAG: major facilitator superfamily domain-containing protein [Benniella sp.]
MQDPMSTDERQPLLYSPEGSRHGDSGAYSQNGDRHQEDGPNKGKTDEASRLAALQALPWYQRPSVYWLLPFVLVLGIDMGMSTAPITYLIIKIVCRRYQQSNNLLFDGDMLYAPEDSCDAPEIQAMGATLMSRTTALEIAIGIFTIGYYTSLSDRYGRKFLIYLTLVQGLIQQALIFYMSRPTNTLGLWALYVNAIFKGLSGAGMLLDPSLSAYTSDCVPSGEMSKFMGITVVFVSVGIIIGPMLGRFLITSTGRTSTPVMVSVCITFLLVLFMAVIPESLPKSAQLDAEREAAERKARNDGSVLAKAKQFFKSIFDPVLFLLPGRMETADDVDTPPSRYTLLIIIAANGVLQVSIELVRSVFIPYMNVVYSWTAVESSTYYIIKGIASFVVFTAIFPGLQKVYKKIAGQEKKSRTVHDETQFTGDAAPAVSGEKNAAVRMDLIFLIFGCIVFLVAFIIVPLSKNETIVLVSACIQELGNVVGPAYLAFMTSHVPSHQTGKALGGMAGLNAIFTSVGTLLGAKIFSKTSTTAPSTVFNVAASISFLAFLITFGVWGSYRRRRVTAL